MKRSPDMVLVVAATFALGVVLTLAMGITSKPSVAAPASPLQAGIVTDR